MTAVGSSEVLDGEHAHGVLVDEARLLVVDRADAAEHEPGGRDARLGVEGEPVGALARDRAAGVMPPKPPDGDDSGVFRSGCASSQSTARSPPLRREACATAASDAPQSPPTVIAQSGTCASASSVRSRTRSRAL